MSLSETKTSFKDLKHKPNTVRQIALELEQAKKKASELKHKNSDDKCYDNAIFYRSPTGLFTLSKYILSNSYCSVSYLVRDYLKL